MATPHLKEAALSVIDMKSWEVIKRIETLGPGFFMRGHENSPYAWVDVSLGPRRTRSRSWTSARSRSWRPSSPPRARPPATSSSPATAATPWSASGRTDGALVVYDAATFEEVKRLPMRKPIGKYNVWNKITAREGTSH